MSEKSESEEFEDEEIDEPGGDDADVDLDKAIKDLDLAKKRVQKGGGEPVWRRLERLLEEKRTAELTSDFDDYDIGDGATKSRRGPKRP